MEIKEVQNRKLVLNMDSLGMKPTIIIMTLTVHNHNYCEDNYKVLAWNV